MTAQSHSPAPFDPVVSDWFARRHGAPTDVQARCWPRIAAGEHVLATAPTGSGKTLGAFLWALDRLLTGAWSGGGVRVVYVSPLKALNNDIHRNLIEPLAELRSAFADAGRDAAAVRVATRSGDTPAEARRSMARHPPEILITTPESLNILLTSAPGRDMLGDVRCVILDEIHAVAANRRGILLMGAVERMAALGTEPQRVALSATLDPLEPVAAMVGGHARPGAPPRAVTTLVSRAPKALDIRVLGVEPEQRESDGGLDLLSPLARTLRARAGDNASTLIFTNSRQLCEKLAFMINGGEDAQGEAPFAYAHHGSLSRELRLDVEARLKRGELKAIVATSSLEMGIDIGALDEVDLVQTPPAISSMIQRAGRAGHGVGQVSRARLFPTHPHDVLEGAVAANAALAGDTETLTPMRGCLDVLAQLIVMWLAAGPLDDDALYDAIRRIHAYADLDRRRFELVVAMLCGRYADSQVRDLRGRLLRDAETGELSLRRGTLLALYASGGVIPDRGYFQLRHDLTQARIGELDEEFVWERSVGQAFTLGSQTWRIQRITHNDVFVVPAPEAKQAPPFWRAEEYDRDAHFAARLGAFLASCDEVAAEAGERDADAALGAWLQQHAPVDALAATMLADYLAAQRSATGAPLPHATHVLAERIDRGPGGYDGAGSAQLVLHTFWGGRINRPLALALEAAWHEAYGEAPEILAGNDAIIVQLSGDADADPFALLRGQDLDALLRQRLEGSGFFGARFRECAARALLLTRQRFGQRLPLWMSRLQAQRLLGRVSRYRDFPVTLEAWRSCLVDAFDLEGLRQRLLAIDDGSIAITRVDTTTPSPFAAQLAWDQINRYMYADDTPAAGPTGTHMDPSLLDDLLQGGQRPDLEPAVCADFLTRRQRLAPGYAPDDPAELLAWIGERELITEGERDALARALADPELMDTVGPDLRALRWPEDRRRWLCRADLAPLIAGAFEAPPRIEQLDGTATELAPRTGERDEAELLLAWLSWQAAPQRAEVAASWPGGSARVNGLLDLLVDDGRLLDAVRVTDDPEAPGSRVCEAENYEALLRMQRARRRDSVQTRPGAELTPWLLDWQGIGGDGSGRSGDPAGDAIEPLLGLPLPVALVEQAILPARIEHYRPMMLDALMTSGTLDWAGCGERELCFLPAGEDALFGVGAPAQPEPRLALPEAARQDFHQLVDARGRDAAAVAEDLFADLFAGHLRADGWAVLRRGLELGFSLPAGAAPARQSRSARRRRLGTRALAYPGSFRRAPSLLQDDAADALERMERSRERARIVLDRYGVISPALLRQERPGFRFRDLFDALRLMELAGEIRGGLFFDGLDGPQFASRDALRTLARFRVDEPRMRWISARDPASPCGLGVEVPGLPLPDRRAGNHLILRGERLVAVSENRGRSLTIEPEPDAADLQPVLEALAMLMRGPGRPADRVVIETVNGDSVLSSPYLDALRETLAVTTDHRAASVPRLP